MNFERIRQNLRLRPLRNQKALKPPRTSSSNHSSHTLGASVGCPQPVDPVTNQDDSNPPPLYYELEQDEAITFDGSELIECVTEKRQPLKRYDSGTGMSETTREEEQLAANKDTPTGADGGSDKGGILSPQQNMPPQRQPLSRRSTARSESASFKPTPQFLSSLMAGSSSSGSEDSSDSSDEHDYDLRPPAPKPKPPSLELTCDLLFSAGHLNTLLHHPTSLARFTSFLHRYSPDDYPLLMRYLETSKAIAAVEYANALVKNAARSAHGMVDGTHAASLDKAFESSYNEAFNTLLHDALPLYTTYNLVRVASECLENEIMGKSTPVMRNLVGGLSEVFCLTDPNQPDNPIIYASEEFYRYTGFGRDSVIGHNCRFLQGPKTQRASSRRLRECLDKGEEVCETLLNYRRDGRPFINLLMIAPLHDDEGNIKYHIGAQVDVSGLVEGGRALDGFQRYLIRRETDRERDEREALQHENDEEARRKHKTLAKLRNLSELFDFEESAVVVTHSRSNSTDRESDTVSISDQQKTPRKVAFVSDGSDDEYAVAGDGEANAWDLGNAGPRGLSGKLPGVYEKYMLIRPAPSLRTIFISPQLKGYGKLVQSPFMAHVAAPATTLNGLMECFKTGTPASAKVNFMPRRGQRREGTKLVPGSRHEDSKYGKACWISATPLRGSDDEVGVWMIVFVERLKGRGKSERYQNLQQGVFSRTLTETENSRVTRRIAQTQQRSRGANVPIKPIRIDSYGRLADYTGRRRVTAPRVDAQDPNADISPNVDREPEDPFTSRPQLAEQRVSPDEHATRGSPSPDLTPPSRRKRFGSDSEDEDMGNDDGLKSHDEHMADLVTPDMVDGDALASSMSIEESISRVRLDEQRSPTATSDDYFSPNSPLIQSVSSNVGRDEPSRPRKGSNDIEEDEAHPRSSSSRRRSSQHAERGRSKHKSARPRTQEELPNPETSQTNDSRSP